VGDSGTDARPTLFGYNARPASAAVACGWARRTVDPMPLHALLLLLLVLLAAGAALAVGVAVLVAYVVLHPPRMTDGKAVYRLRRLSPGDLGLRFDAERYTVRDASTGRPLQLAAWWIPAAQPSAATAVLLHGYADAKVGAIAWAPPLHALGLNVLAVDLRAHGESDGTICTGGPAEADDLNQLIDQLLARRPESTGHLVLFGASLGAAVAAATASGRNDVSAVVLESPFASYRRAVRAHAKLVGLPGGLPLRLAIAIAETAAGHRFDAARPVDRIPRISCPTLVIVGEADLLLDATDVAMLRDAVARQGNPASTLWAVPAAGHLLALHVDPAGYRHRLAAVLRAGGVVAAGDVDAAGYRDRE
jgi:pimeloyl-ACP methyl ester carboxylesterase